MKGEPPHLDRDSDLTTLLRRWSSGDPGVQNELITGVYGELKRLARIQLAGERAGHTLQPTALVHEAYMKIASGASMDWRDRVHFMAVAARVMRQVLVDAGRKRQAAKRTPDRPLTAPLAGPDTAPVDVLDLDRALVRLERLNASQARIVELRCYGGLSVAEVAEVLNVSVATVNRAWRAARLWLKDELEPEPGS